MDDGDGCPAMGRHVRPLKFTLKSGSGGERDVAWIFFFFFGLNRKKRERGKDKEKKVRRDRKQDGGGEGLGVDWELMFKGRESESGERRKFWKE